MRVKFNAEKNERIVDVMGYAINVIFKAQILLHFRKHEHTNFQISVEQKDYSATHAPLLNIYLQTSKLFQTELRKILTKGNLLE